MEANAKNAGRIITTRIGDTKMAKIVVKQFDQNKNSDMVTIGDDKGVVFGMIHIDAFWNGKYNLGSKVIGTNVFMEKDNIYRRLSNGEELTLNVKIDE